MPREKEAGRLLQPLRNEHIYIYIYIIFYAILWSVSGENLPHIGAEVVVPILASKVAALAEDRKSRCAVVLTFRDGKMGMG